MTYNYVIVSQIKEIEIETETEKEERETHKG
jgi:hypothetical protein